MTRCPFTLAFLTTLSLALAPAMAAEPERLARKPFGIDKRVPWTTSQVIGSPEPPPPYRTARAFRGLTFSEPLDLAAAPGTDRLWVAERKGKLLSFVNQAEVKQADVALDLAGKTIYGLTIHPKFKENGYVYIAWIPDGSREGFRMARAFRGSRRRGSRRRSTGPASR